MEIGKEPSDSYKVLIYFLWSYVLEQLAWSNTRISWGDDEIL
jgi:hypothetical protein